MPWARGDPFPAPSIQRSGRSPQSTLYELGLYEAVVGNLTLPAISGLSPAAENGDPNDRKTPDSRSSRRRSDLCDFHSREPSAAIRAHTIPFEIGTSSPSRCARRHRPTNRTMIWSRCYGCEAAVARYSRWRSHRAYSWSWPAICDSTHAARRSCAGHGAAPAAAFTIS